MAKLTEEKRAYMAKWRAANREKMRLYAIGYRAKNANLIVTKRKAHYAKNAERLRANQKKYLPYSREFQRKRKGLPTPTRLAPEACECCGGKQKRALALDHCHETGKFRGWLCSTCNTGIGSLGDNAEGLIAALLYLERHRG